MEALPEMEMMNDFSSISYEIEHILEEVRLTNSIFNHKQTLLNYSYDLGFFGYIL